MAVRSLTENFGERISVQYSSRLRITLRAEFLSNTLESLGIITSPKSSEHRRQLMKNRFSPPGSA